MSETVSKKKKFSTLELVDMAIFSALMAVCSWISIPAPAPLAPFTMQTFGVFIALLMLGAKRGGLSILVFVLMAIAGLPVLAGFSGGIGAVFGTTGGYILGFLLAAPVYWLCIKMLGEKQWVKVMALVIGLAVCYLFGTLWFMVVYTRQVAAVGFVSALGWCVLPYVLPDIGKLLLAWGLAAALSKRIKL